MSVGAPRSGQEAFSLEDWYTDLAPLQETQRLSVSRVSAWSSESVKEAEAEETPRAPEPSLAALLDTLTTEIDEEDAARYDTHLCIITDCIRELDELLATADAAQLNMEELRTGLTFVEESTRELLGQTEDLLQMQTKLEGLHEQIGLRLSYFSVLPQATALASSSSLDLVDQPAFLDMLKRLELALQFMSTHIHYADAQLYQMRLSHCLLRFLTMVHTQFVKHGADDTDAALAQLQEVNRIRDFTSEAGTLDLYSGPMTEALYGRFIPLQSTFRPLLEMMEAFESPARAPVPAAGKAASASTGDIHDVVQECRTVLVRWRTTLAKEALRMYLNDHTRRMQHDPSDQALLTSCEQAALFVHGLACQEVALYTTFFRATLQEDHTPSSVLGRLLHALGEQLLSFIETLVPQHATPDQLASVCNLFQTIPAPKATALPLATKGVDPMDAGQQHQCALMWTQPVLHELCARLVRSAQAMLTKNILAFTPKADDLLYPQCLLDQREALVQEQTKLAQATRGKVLRHTKRASAVGAGLLESLVGCERTAPTLFSKPSPVVYASWYAPVRTALDLLSTLHTHVPLAALIEVGSKSIDAAQDAVAHAAMLLRDGKFGAPDGAVGAVDGYLFQLRHLFVLQELCYSIEIASQSTGGHAANDPSDMRLDPSGMHLFGVRVPDAGVVLDTIHSIWNATRYLSRSDPQPDPPLETNPALGAQAALRATQQRVHAAIAETTTMASDLAARNLTLPLQIFLTQTERQSDLVDASKAFGAWKTFQQSLDVNLDELRNKLFVYISDEAALQNLLDTTIVRCMLT